MQKVQVNGQLVPKTEWRQTDGRAEAIALPSSLIRLVTIFNSFLGLSLEPDKQLIYVRPIALISYGLDQQAYVL